MSEHPESGPPAHPPEEPREATKGEVRALGVFFAVGGLLLFTLVPREYVVSGVIPVSWFGLGVLVLGAAMILFPGRSFRQRASRFNEIGEAFRGNKEEPKDPES